MHGRDRVKRISVKQFPLFRSGLINGKIHFDFSNVLSGLLVVCVKTGEFTLYENILLPVAESQSSTTTVNRAIYQSRASVGSSSPSHQERSTFTAIALQSIMIIRDFVVSKNGQISCQVNPCNYIIYQTQRNLPVAS